MCIIFFFFYIASSQLKMLRTCLIKHISKSLDLWCWIMIPAGYIRGYKDVDLVGFKLSQGG